MLFGVTTDKFIRYLAPIEYSDLIEYGFGSDNLEELLTEKSEIVFSYLPRKYRNQYQERVENLILVTHAYDGQDHVKTPYTGMSNVVAYLNPSTEMSEKASWTTTAVTVDDGLGRIDFTTPLVRGDKVVIDFDSVLEDVSIRPLVWAVNVLAGIDILSMVAGDTKTAQILPRVKFDSERVFPWLQALNSPSMEDRVIVKDLEFDFYEGEKNVIRRMDEVMERLTNI